METQTKPPSNRLFFRLLAMGSIVVILLVALAMVRGLVNERTARAQAVQNSLGVGSQTLAGPVLVFPYTETTWQRTPDGERWESATADHALQLEPQRLDVTGQLNVEVLKRGLYEAPVYSSNLQMKGHYTLAPLLALLESTSTEKDKDRKVSRQWKAPYVSLELTHALGIRALKARLADTPLVFEAGAGGTEKVAGVHASLAMGTAALAKSFTVAGDPTASGEVAFALELELAGSQALLFEPQHAQSTIALTGNWPHPGFVGPLNPVKRNVTDKGFEANWSFHPLAAGTTTDSNDGLPGARNAVGVRVLDPVERYVLTDRTTKYAELFLLLTFGAVFLLEIYRRMAVHPVQYGLVGAALTLFFVLTLALSEHISFGLAYSFASGATVTLLSYYSIHMLKSTPAGLCFGGALAALYGLLFVILKAEDVALLLGALTLFAALTLFMVLTRKVDWFSATGMAVGRQPG
jgi:inner membrane protein